VQGHAAAYALTGAGDDDDPSRDPLFHGAAAYDTSVRFRAGNGAREWSTSGHDASMTDDLDLLAGSWDWWAGVGEHLDDAGWSAPTRLPGWDVRALYAHHSQYAVMLTLLAASPAEAPADHDAASLLRYFNEPGGLATTAAPGVQERALADATSRETGELVARFRETAVSAIDAVRAQDRTTVVNYFGLARLSLAEVLRVGLLEAVVHGLDLSAALRRPHGLPTEAVVRTAALLAELPEPVAFVDAATGRSMDPVLPVLR
jgi:uncharacterized protein (TIGR03083 family)